MRLKLPIFTLWALMLSSCVSQAVKPTTTTNPERTAFQNAAPWSEDFDIRSDVAIVYGIGNAKSDDFEKKVQSYRDRGYGIHFMTGSAWGHPDYVMGESDGKTHYDEGQVNQNGDTIRHGANDPYMVPTPDFTNHLKRQIKRAIDAGATAVHMEEPEFWSRSGYSDSFKRAWQEYYGTPWVAQHISPEATYHSAKLKYHLYYVHLEALAKYTKQYAKEVGKQVMFYIPTHSLINYSAWRIVSPEASLAAIPEIDGYIAQVWTGTAREPIYYNGKVKERVFENAFLEYGSVISMTAPTGRKTFLLADPIEDWPRSWADYKDNYQATFAAKVLYPMANNYEVMPWPSRIYQGKFRISNVESTQDGTPLLQPQNEAQARGPEHELQGIPAEYATQVQVMINTLNEMPISENRVSGTQGIGVLLCNSMMFQPFPEHNNYKDPRLSNYYGMSMPILKRGIPMESVHYENMFSPETLKGIKVLVMSYANMKPLSPDGHKTMAEWVRNGGVIIYIGKDNDPYQSVKEWWNSDSNNFTSPSEHLFSLLGIKSEKNGAKRYEVGKGAVHILRNDPKEYILTDKGDEQFIETLMNAYEQDAKGDKIEVKNSLYLERGPYTIAAVLAESVSTEPLIIKGSYIDLFDPTLPILNDVKVEVDKEVFLYALSRIEGEAPKVLCGASRVTDEVIKKNSYSFVAKSPARTNNVQRILLSKEPKVVNATNALEQNVDLQYKWDEESKTLWIAYINSPDGITVYIEY